MSVVAQPLVASDQLHSFLVSGTSPEATIVRFAVGSKTFKRCGLRRYQSVYNAATIISGDSLIIIGGIYSEDGSPSSAIRIIPLSGWGGGCGASIETSKVQLPCVLTKVKAHAKGSFLIVVGEDLHGKMKCCLFLLNLSGSPERCLGTSIVSQTSLEIMDVTARKSGSISILYRFHPHEAASEAEGLEDEGLQTRLNLGLILGRFDPKAKEFRCHWGQPSVELKPKERKLAENERAENLSTPTSATGSDRRRNSSSSLKSSRSSSLSSTSATSREKEGYVSRYIPCLASRLIEDHRGNMRVVALTPDSFCEISITADLDNLSACVPPITSLSPVQHPENLGPWITSKFSERGFLLVEDEGIRVLDPQSRSDDENSVLAWDFYSPSEGSPQRGTSTSPRRPIPPATRKATGRSNSAVKSSTIDHSNSVGAAAPITSKMLLRIHSTADADSSKGVIRASPRTDPSALKPGSPLQPATVQVHGEHPLQSQVAIDSVVGPMDVKVKAEYHSNSDDTVINLEWIDVQRLVAVKLEQHVYVGEARKKKYQERFAELERGFNRLKEEHKKLDERKMRLVEEAQLLDKARLALEEEKLTLSQGYRDLEEAKKLHHLDIQQLEQQRTEIQASRDRAREAEQEAEKKLKQEKDKARQHDRDMETERKKQQKKQQQLDSERDLCKEEQSKAAREMERIGREREQHKREASLFKANEELWRQERADYERSLVGVKNELQQNSSSIDQLAFEKKELKLSETKLKDEIVKQQKQIETLNGRGPTESDGDYSKRCELKQRLEDAVNRGRFTTVGMAIDLNSKARVSYVLGAEGCATPLFAKASVSVSEKDITLKESATLDLEIGEGYVIGDELLLDSPHLSLEPESSRIGILGKMNREIVATASYRSRSAKDAVRFSISSNSSEPLSSTLTLILQAIRFRTTRSDLASYGLRKVEGYINIASTKTLYQFPFRCDVTVITPPFDSFREPDPYLERTKGVGLLSHFRIVNPYAQTNFLANQHKWAETFLTSGYKGIIDSSDSSENPSYSDPHCAVRLNRITRFSHTLPRRCITCNQTRSLSVEFPTQVDEKDIFCSGSVEIRLDKLQQEDKLLLNSEIIHSLGKTVKFVTRESNDVVLMTSCSADVGEVTKSTWLQALGAISFVSTGIPLDDQPRTITVSVDFPHMLVPCKYTTVFKLRIVNSAHEVKVSSERSHYYYRPHLLGVGQQLAPPLLHFAKNCVVTDPLLSKFGGTLTVSLKSPFVPGKDRLDFTPLRGYALLTSSVVDRSKTETSDALAVKYEVQYSGMPAATVEVSEDYSLLTIHFHRKSTAETAEAVLRSVTFSSICPQSTVEDSITGRKLIKMVAALGRGHADELMFTAEMSPPILKFAKLGGLKWIEHQGAVFIAMQFALTLPSQPTPNLLIHFKIVEGAEQGDFISLLNPNVAASSSRSDEEVKSTGTKAISTLSFTEHPSGEANQVPYLRLNTEDVSTQIQRTFVLGDRERQATAYQLVDGSLVIRFGPEQSRLQIQECQLDEGGNPRNILIPGSILCEKEIDGENCGHMEDASLIQEVLSLVTYKHTTLDPRNLKKIVSASIEEYNGTVHDSLVALSIVPVDDPTEIHHVPRVSVYCQGSIETARGFALCPQAKLHDPDTEDFIGGSLSIEPTEGWSAKDVFYLLSPEQQIQHQRCLLKASENQSLNTAIVYVDIEGFVFVFDDLVAFRNWERAVSRNTMYGETNDVIKECVGQLLREPIGATIESQPTMLLQSGVQSGTYGSFKGSDFLRQSGNLTDQPSVPGASIAPQVICTTPERWTFTFTPKTPQLIPLEKVQAVLRCLAFSNDSSRMNTDNRRFKIRLGAGSLSETANVEGAKLADVTEVFTTIQVIPAVLYSPGFQCTTSYIKGSGPQPIGKPLSVLPINPLIETSRSYLTAKLSEDSTDDESLGLQIRKDSGLALEMEGNTVTLKKTPVGVVIATRKEIRIELADGGSDGKLDPKVLQALVRSITYTNRSQSSSKWRRQVFLEYHSDFTLPEHEYVEEEQEETGEMEIVEIEEEGVDDEDLSSEKENHTKEVEEADSTDSQMDSKNKTDPAGGAHREAETEETQASTANEVGSGDGVEEPLGDVSEQQEGDQSAEPLSASSKPATEPSNAYGDDDFEEEPSTKDAASVREDGVEEVLAEGVATENSEAAKPLTEIPSASDGNVTMVDSQSHSKRVVPSEGEDPIGESIKTSEGGVESPNAASKKSVAFAESSFAADTSNDPVDEPKGGNQDQEEQVEDSPSSRSPRRRTRQPSLKIVKRHVTKKEKPYLPPNSVFNCALVIESSGESSERDRFFFPINGSEQYGQSYIMASGSSRIFREVAVRISDEQSDSSPLLRPKATLLITPPAGVTLSFDNSLHLQSRKHSDPSVEALEIVSYGTPVATFFNVINKYNPSYRFEFAATAPRGIVEETLHQIVYSGSKRDRSGTRLLMKLSLLAHGIEDALEYPVTISPPLIDDLSSGAPLQVNPAGEPAKVFGTAKVRCSSGFANGRISIDLLNPHASDEGSSNSGFHLNERDTVTIIPLGAFSFATDQPPSGGWSVSSGGGSTTLTIMYKPSSEGWSVHSSKEARNGVLFADVIQSTQSLCLQFPADLHQVVTQEVVQDFLRTCVCVQQLPAQAKSRAQSPESTDSPPSPRNPVEDPEAGYDYESKYSTNIQIADSSGATCSTHVLVQLHNPAARLKKGKSMKK